MISRNVVQMSFSSDVIVFMDFFEDALQGYNARFNAVPFGPPEVLAQIAGIKH